MSLFRNEARREQRSSRLSTADVAAMGEAQATRPMAEEQPDVEDAVVVTREPVTREDRPAMQTQEPVKQEERREEPVQAPPAKAGSERLAALFNAEAASDFRSRWDATQISFVDDPRRAVQQADELVAEVMQRLAQTFADERKQLEAQMNAENASTENLRVALQRYRSFFQRMLSL